MSHRKTPEQNDARIRALKVRLIGVIALGVVAAVGVGGAALTVLGGSNDPAIAAPSATGDGAAESPDLVVREVTAEVDVAATQPQAAFEDATFTIGQGIDAVDVAFGTRSESLTSLEVTVQGGSVEVLLHDGTRKTVRDGTSVDLSFVGEAGGTIVRVVRADDESDGDVAVLMRMRRGR